MQEISRSQLIEQLQSLGVRRGGVCVVHTSFRAVRPVEGGPLGLIDALCNVLGTEGTLVMPTMTDGETVFDPKSTPTCDMGIVAELFWRKPGVLRSTHPGASFAAIDPHAERICQPQPLAPPHGPDSPIGRVHELDGQVLLLGVKHSENTSIHLAEAMAGVPYFIEHPCVVELDGVAHTVMLPEQDHCCEGFNLVDEWLRTRGLQREGVVGHAPSRLCAARDVVSVVVAALQREPLRFLCPESKQCVQCDAARASAAHR